MPTDSELQSMKAVYARIERNNEGWRATIIRLDEKGTRREYEETLNTRSRRELAFADVAFYVPKMHPKLIKVMDERVYDIRPTRSRVRKTAAFARKKRARL